MATMSPLEMLNKVRKSANLETKDYEKSLAIKVNKPGKIKFQLLALNEDYLFKARTQHFIQTLPDNDDPNEKIMVVDCKGEGCPICDAALSFKNSGVKVEDINAAYKSKYSYTKLRSFLTQPEHYLVAIKILADQADEGTYLPKDAELGSTQLLQLSKSALNSLMAAYEDFILDCDEPDSVPPLFGIFGDSKTVKSLTINLRIQVQGAWSYIFSFGKGIETELKDVDVQKIKFLEEAPTCTEDYMEKAIKRIHDIQAYFTGGSKVEEFNRESAANSGSSKDFSEKTEVDESDFDLDGVL